MKIKVKTFKFCINKIGEGIKLNGPICIIIQNITFNLQIFKPFD